MRGTLAAFLVLIAGSVAVAEEPAYSSGLELDYATNETDAAKKSRVELFPAPVLQSTATQEGRNAQVRAASAFQWLRSQPEPYQQAIAKGELPEDEAGQRQIGQLIRALRAYYGDDQGVTSFLLGANSLPWLVELRSALSRHLSGSENGLEIQMVLTSATVRTNPKVQALLGDIRTQAYLLTLE